MTLATVLAGAGCTSPATPPPVEKNATVSDTPAVEPAQSRPEFYPGGSAEENLPIFELTLEESGAGAPRADIAVILEGLVQVGFERDSLSHTAPTSKVKLPADSISIAVEVGNDCLIGQFSEEWLAVAIAEPTPTGCLIGDVVELTSLDASN